MGFFKKSSNQDYDLWSSHAWYVPGVGGMFMLLVMLLVGALIANLVSAVFIMAMGEDAGMEWGTLIAYVLMFIPPLIYARHCSMRNAMFEEGYALDSNNFAPKNGWLLALLCMIATFALGFCMDLINSQLPPMPEWLEEALSSMTSGNFLMNFLSVSIFAPLLEEWLCRGMVLRGLLNHKKQDGTYMKPLWAIVISALFFAFIHMNPWQGIPAFALGCLFGYVYWKTGSLKLTMLMHFTNNTLALCMGQFWPELADMDSWLDVLSGWQYAIGFVICAAFMVLFVMVFRKVRLLRNQGNSDVIPVE